MLLWRQSKDPRCDRRVQNRPKVFDIVRSSVWVTEAVTKDVYYMSVAGLEGMLNNIFSHIGRPGTGSAPERSHFVLEPLRLVNLEIEMSADCSYK